MYEGLDRWADASLWYESALCASMTTNGPDCEVTARLEEALEHKRFPYPQVEIVHGHDYSIVYSARKVKLGYAKRKSTY